MELLGPEGYDQLRTPFTGRVPEVRPRAVARCADAADVVAALAYARQRGWPFAVRSGGHSNAGWSGTEGLLLDVTPAGSIELDGSRVSVGGGVRVGDLAAALAPHGRLVPSGSCPSVGVVGATLGGGFGMSGRLHGLTCDRLVEAEVVLAGGQVVVADADREPDLFWALRGGGGGNVGVVTRAVYETARATARTHFRASWPGRLAAVLVGHWLATMPDAPPEVSADLALIAQGDELEVVLFGVLSGGTPGAGRLIAAAADRAGAPGLTEIVELSPAQAAAAHPTPYAAAAREPAHLPPPQGLSGMYTARTEFFDRPLPAAGVQALLAELPGSRVRGENRIIDFTPWRGAYAALPWDATAFAHREAAYLVKHTVVVGPRGAAERGPESLAWLDRSWGAIHPWGTGRAYQNFPDPALPDWPHAYYAGNLERLRQVKAHYDPDGLFAFPHAVAPAGVPAG